MHVRQLQEHDDCNLKTRTLIYVVYNRHLYLALVVSCDAAYSWQTRSIAVSPANDKHTVCCLRLIVIQNVIGWSESDAECRWSASRSGRFILVPVDKGVWMLREQERLLRCSIESRLSDCPVCCLAAIPSDVSGDRGYNVMFVHADVTDTA
jgi:hypothetical protein